MSWANVGTLLNSNMRKRLLCLICLYIYILLMSVLLAMPNQLTMILPKSIVKNHIGIALNVSWEEGRAM